MRILAILAIPAIVATSLTQAGVQPEPVEPAVLSQSKEERMKLLAGLAEADARRSGGAALY